MIATSCPHCGTSYRLPDTQAGKKVRCKTCDGTFAVQDDVPVLEEAEPAPRKAKAKPAEALPVLDEAPRERVRTGPARSRPRDDEDDRPVRRRSRDDDDDYDDRPRRPSGDGSSGAALALVAIVGVCLLLLVGGIGLVWWLSSSPDPAPAPTPAPLPQPAPTPQPAVPVPAPPPPAGDQLTIQSIDEALAGLGDRNPGRRREALAYLRATKPDPARQDQVAQALVRLVNEPFVGQQAADALAEWATPAVLDDVARMLEDTAPGASRRAMPIAKKFADHDKILPVLGRMFGSSRPSFDSVTELLGKAGKKAEPYVLPHLNHKDTFVRRDAEQLLTQFGTDEKALIAQTVKDLASLEKEVRESAARRVVKYRPDPADPEQQAKAAKALEAMRKEPFLRGEVATALEAWATKETVPALIEALEEFGLEQPSTARALARLKDERSFVPLAAYYIKRPSPSHLDLMYKTFVAFGPPAEETVQKIVGNENNRVSRTALNILAEIGGPTTVTQLTTPKVVAAIRARDRESGPLIAAVVAKIKSRTK